jgi:hypothetical protein
LEPVKRIEPSYSAWKSANFLDGFMGRSDILQLFDLSRSLPLFFVVGNELRPKRRAMRGCIVAEYRRRAAERDVPAPFKDFRKQRCAAIVGGTRSRCHRSGSRNGSHSGRLF